MSADVSALLPSDTVKSPDEALREAFLRETKIGVLLVIAARVIWMTADLVNYFSNVLPTSRGAPKFFHLPYAVLFSVLPIHVVFIAVFIFALRTKKPLVWCAVLMLADLAILSETTFFWLWRPVVIMHAPMFLSVRYQDVVSFAVLSVFYVLPLSRALTIGAGAGCFLIWAAGISYDFLIYKHGLIYWGPFGSGIGNTGLRSIQDAETLVVDYFIIQLVLIAVLTYFLVMSTQKARRFVVARVAAEVDLVFLSRFFPPVVAQQISRAGSHRIAPARRCVAVLFADMDRDRGEVDLAQLQAFYTQVESVAFAHGAVIDRFSGGPIMLTFGALESDETAASHALSCALALARTSEVRFVVVHIGSAVAGELGATRARTFSVVGDVVNTTRRVLDVARVERAAVVLTDDAVDALDQRPAGIVELPATTLRGRTAPITLWSVAP